ncbi:hypothetical protein DXG03_000999 [Asterophora parasitica]|uniref:Uncharacterized protein n=1 Tax=Asterophora parasitica TaxID=117018 RepID=A0A9P7G5Y6_9AGAR|nr:hypothetical protein DXG03_000999 [Asterophora parasitica]
MPLTTVLGLFKGAVRTPRREKPTILSLNAKFTTHHVARQQPAGLAGWTKLWRPMSIYAPFGQVLRELRTTTTFTKPYLFHLPNVFYSPLWRRLFSKEEYTSRSTAVSFWSLPKVEYYSLMRRYIGLDENLKVSADNSFSIAEGLSPLPQSSNLSATPEEDLVSSEPNNSPTVHSSKASASQTSVAIPNGEDSGAAEVPHSAENSSLPLPLLPSQTHVPPAFTSQKLGSSSSSSSAWVVPDMWKQATSLTLKTPISPEMFLAVLRECAKVRKLSVNICPSSSFQQLDEQIDNLVTTADNLEMLSITTSAEPYPILKSLHLPRLKVLSLDWDRSLGRDFPRDSCLDLTPLFKTSSLKSLSLSNIFPLEDSIISFLQSRGDLVEELAIRGDFTPQLLAIPIERLVTGRTLSALSEHDVCCRLRTLDLSYISAHENELTTMITSRKKGSTPWHLEFSFLKETGSQSDMDALHKHVDAKFTLGVKEAELLVIA